MNRLSDVVWAELLGHVRRLHPELSSAGLSRLEAGTLDRGELTIRVEDEAQRADLTERAGRAFAEAAQTATGHLVSVRFLAAAGSARPAAALLRAGAEAGSSFNPDYVFETFITGPENRMAHAACRAVADAPGHAYNPLFIHGASGLGKTHLLQSIGQQVRSSRPETRIVYQTCESFVNDYIESVQHGDMLALRQQYRGTDLLLVDDMQFLGRGERSQDEFFHTFNTLYQSQRQIVLSADCAPDEIPNLAERLVSRFRWGLVTRLDPLCVETRIAILRTKAHRRELNVPDDVLDYIGNHVKGNARELEGALLCVRATADTLHAGITLELAQRALRSEPAAPAAGRVSIERIIAEVAERFDVRPPDMRGRRRHRSVALARQACMYLARRMTEHSLEEIGGFLGRRDHTTVLHAQRVIARRRESDARLASLLDEIEERLSRPLTG